MQAGEKASVVFSKSGNVEFWSENREAISFQDLNLPKILQQYGLDQKRLIQSYD